MIRRSSAPSYCLTLLVSAVVVLVMLSITPVTSIISPALAAGTVPLHQVHEVSLTTTRSYANPFTEVDLSVTVRDPDGGSRQVDGFYDGDGNGGQSGSVWKFRVSPDRGGTWSWTTSSNDPDLGGKSGSFSVSGAISGPFSQGPIVASPSSPRYFKYQNGPHLFLIGKFLEENLSSSTLRYSHVMLGEGWADADRGALVSRHRAMGLNKVNLYVANRGDYSSQSVTPWVGSASGNDKARFDLARWRVFDQWVQRLQDEGMAAEFWFFADDSGFGSLSQPDRERLFEYAMARLSPFVNTMFIHSLEWSEGFTSSEVDSDARFIQAHNPWDRLVSVHGTTGDFSFPSAPWADYMATQVGFGRGHASVNSFSLKQRSLANKPHLLEELALGNETDSQRQESWAALMGGAAGIGTGGYLAHLSSFASRVPLQLMEPANSLLTSGSGYVLAQSGREYVAYLPSGGSATLDLSAVSGSLAAQWYDPRTGSYSGQTTVSGGASRAFSAPASGDWVLYLPSSESPVATQEALPQFMLGFAELARQIPAIVGEPLESEHWGPSGDSLQATTHGLMVWRKADNWTAFTDGSWTWVNGPNGVQSRPNDQRFSWEGSA